MELKEQKIINIKTEAGELAKIINKPVKIEIDVNPAVDSVKLKLTENY